jgi:UrcA family protein
MKTPVLAAALAVLSLAASAGAAAAQDYRIAFGDLDLGSARGADAFDRRLDRAVRQACGRSGSPVIDSRCAVMFRREAMRLLPGEAQAEYARARGGRLLVMVPLVYG